jgi:molybdopterin converting factor small subunit
MKVTVEFTGLARSIAGQKTTAVELAEPATYRDIIRQVGRTFPALLGLLIDSDGETFLSGNMFVINGDLSTPAMVMGESPHEGDHLIIMSLVTGG